MTETANPVVTIPEDMRDIFSEPALGHVAYQAASGKLAIWPMWVSWDGTHLLTSTRAGARKLAALRTPGASIAVSIVSIASPWRWVSVTGHVVETHPDEGLAFIDSQARRYIGSDYRDREHPREVIVIALDRVNHSTGRW